MKVSVILVDGGFREKFHTLKFLFNQSFMETDYEVLWVEFYNQASHEVEREKRVRLIKLGHTPGEEYHSSRCFNEGIRRSRGELLVILDADLAVGPDFLSNLWKEHERSPELAMYLYRFNEPENAHDELRSYELDYLKKVSIMNNPTNYGACLSIRKKWLLEINGYEEDPVFGSGFHANGLDVYTRLKNFGLAVRWHPTEWVYHPWHPSTLAGSRRYIRQKSIIQKRQLNLEFLPNLGLKSEKNRREADVPDDSFWEKIRQRLGGA